MKIINTPSHIVPFLAYKVHKAFLYLKALYPKIKNKAKNTVNFEEYVIE